MGILKQKGTQCHLTRLPRGLWMSPHLFLQVLLHMCWHQFHSCHKGRGNGMLFHTTPGQIQSDGFDRLVGELLLLL